MKAIIDRALCSLARLRYGSRTVAGANPSRLRGSSIGKIKVSKT